MIFWIDIAVFIFLVLCLLLVAIFEFINWFHDTANAVAPVIYTKSLKPKKAVLIAWIMNFFWVVFWWIWVAMAIIYLLPLDVISYQSTSFWVIVVISLLLSAIIWNFATWYFWIPASSSHSLIWAILWVTIIMMFIPNNWNLEVIPNWWKAIEVIESLLFSPFLWFILASLIMILSFKFIKNRYYFKTPWKSNHSHPKKWLRIMLIFTSAWVSFAHWSNDWQKWVWLAMLILVLLAPSVFAINPEIKLSNLEQNISNVENKLQLVNLDLLSNDEKENINDIKNNLKEIKKNIDLGDSYNKIELRKEILSFKKNIWEFEKNFSINNSDAYLVSVVNSNESINNNLLNNWAIDLDNDLWEILKVINYAPMWVILFISISLWLWTMIWRKRIVVTIWEKIGNTQMNYTQATTSAFITAMTITLASQFHLPVSTTHILSSSVAWTMSVWPNKSWVRGSTIKNILTAWILTLPVTMFLSWFIFFILWLIFVN